MPHVTNLNHAVLYVSDVARSLDFYLAFGFEVVDRMGDQAGSQVAGGENHHELALMSVGPNAPRPPRGSVGLYHLAWEVATIEDLAEMAQKLTELDALGGMSDHGVSKSLYAPTPTASSLRSCIASARTLGRARNEGRRQTLDLQKEIARFGAKTSA